MSWHDHLPALSRAYPHSPRTELPAQATHLNLYGFKDLSPLGSVRGVRALHIENGRPDELARLAELAPELDTLVVGGRHVTNLDYLRGVGAPRTVVLADHTKLERLDGIEALTSVTTLMLENVPRVRDLAPLARLQQLRELRFETLMSGFANGSMQRVDSLAPLASIATLERLSFFCVTARDGDLTPLHALPNLDDVYIPLTYSAEQIARLCGARGWSAEDWPATEPTGHACERCGADGEVLLVGVRRRRYTCPACEPERIERHVAAFEAWRAEAAAARAAP